MTCIDEQPAIELRDVGVKRSERWIASNINWKVRAGTCAAILGPNGSGKSTLARVITGYIWPTCGDVFVAGQHFGEVDLNELRRSIRLVQAAGPYDVDPELTAQEVVLTGLFGTIGLFDPVTDADRKHADDLLTQVGLTKLRGARYSTFSNGERVRSLIARSLIVRPKILLLDEPTAGLDLLAREQVLATIQALFTRGDSNVTVLLITHHVDELPPATSDVLLLSEGKVAAQGRPEDVLRSEVLSPVYNCRLHVDRHGDRYYVRVDPTVWSGLL
ncbi:MAG TPA: ATP-binding cassette domain-containing protein [Tepidisphaeraceae bacterium]|jgi:iron complex transport system ATP-binding protein|nr:ATP-binding cassette domain-containing protein [Tepidisphaeraceae bacterium]